MKKALREHLMQLSDVHQRSLVHEAKRLAQGARNFWRGYSANDVVAAYGGVHKDQPGDKTMKSLCLGGPLHGKFHETGGAFFVLVERLECGNLETFRYDARALGSTHVYVYGDVDIIQAIMELIAHE